MTKDEIFARVRKIIAEETCVPESDILWDSDIAKLEERAPGTKCFCCHSQPK